MQWQLGNEYFKTGNLKGAEEHYQDSLETYPGYHRALAGMAQVRAAQGNLADAAGLYNQAIAVIPMPEYAAAWPTFTLSWDGQGRGHAAEPGGIHRPAQSDQQGGL